MIQIALISVSLPFSQTPAYKARLHYCIARSACFLLAFASCAFPQRGGQAELIRVAGYMCGYLVQ